MTGSYAAHQNLIQEFKHLCIKQIPNLHLFDRHVGLFYTKRGTPVQISIPGMADVYGFYGPFYIEVEFKSGNAVQSKEQKRWEQFIKKNGGIYILVKNPQDSINELKEILNARQISRDDQSRRPSL